LHQHNLEGQGEQLGWGMKWEIFQLLSLPKQTHCVPTPSAHGDQASENKKKKKKKKQKGTNKTPTIQEMRHTQ